MSTWCSFLSINSKEENVTCNENGIFRLLTWFCRGTVLTPHISRKWQYNDLYRKIMNNQHHACISEANYYCVAPNVHVKLISSTKLKNTFLSWYTKIDKNLPSSISWYANFNTFDTWFSCFRFYMCHQTYVIISKGCSGQWLSTSVKTFSIFLDETIRVLYIVLRHTGWK